MPNILVLIHTVSPLIKVFDQLCADLLPGIQLKHILDEPLLEIIRQRGSSNSSDAARLWDHVKIAESIHSRAVLITCSLLSTLIDDIRPLTAVPLVKIDEAMISAAIKAGSHIGVLATNITVLKSTQQNLDLQAQQSGKVITYELRLVDGAFDAFLAGRTEEHDRLIRQAISKFPKDIDAIVLAQASMASVINVIPEAEMRVPILSSPNLALEQVRYCMGNLGWG